jgi:hypothetical protein
MYRGNENNSGNPTTPERLAAEDDPDDYDDDEPASTGFLLRPITKPPEEESNAEMQPCRSTTPRNSLPLMEEEETYNAIAWQVFRDFTEGNFYPLYDNDQPAKKNRSAGESDESNSLSHIAAPTTTPPTFVFRQTTAAPPTMTGSTFTFGTSIATPARPSAFGTNVSSVPNFSDVYPPNTNENFPPLSSFGNPTVLPPTPAMPLFENAGSVPPLFGSTAAPASANPVLGVGEQHKLSVDVLASSEVWSVPWLVLWLVLCLVLWLVLCLEPWLVLCLVLCLEPWSAADKKAGDFVKVAFRRRYRWSLRSSCIRHCRNNGLLCSWKN